MPPSTDVIRPFLIPVLISLAALCSAAGFGVAFGAFEDDMKGGLNDSAAVVIDSVYGGDAAKAKAVIDKSWVYYKRAHLHVGALGAQGLMLTMLLAMLGAASLRMRQVAAMLQAAGGLGYGWFWYVAGHAAPALGGTGAAKEATAWLALPSVVAMSAGLLLTIVAVVFTLRAPRT